MENEAFMQINSNMMYREARVRVGVSHTSCQRWLTIATKGSCAIEWKWEVKGSLMFEAWRSIEAWHLKLGGEDSFGM